MKIEFEKVTEDGHVFRDAIELPDDHELTARQIGAIKTKRIKAWTATLVEHAQQNQDN